MRDIVREEILNMLRTFLNQTSDDGGWHDERRLAEKLIDIFEGS